MLFFEFGDEIHYYYNYGTFEEVLPCQETSKASRQHAKSNDTIVVCTRQ